MKNQALWGNSNWISLVTGWAGCWTHTQPPVLPPWHKAHGSVVPILGSQMLTGTIIPCDFSTSLLSRCFLWGINRWCNIFTLCASAHISIYVPVSQTPLSLVFLSCCFQTPYLPEGHAICHCPGICTFSPQATAPSTSSGWAGSLLAAPPTVLKGTLERGYKVSIVYFQLQPCTNLINPWTKLTFFFLCQMLLQSPPTGAGTRQGVSPGAAVVGDMGSASSQSLHVACGPSNAPSQMCHFNLVMDSCYLTVKCSISTMTQ